MVAMLATFSGYYLLEISFIRARFGGLLFVLTLFTALAPRYLSFSLLFGILDFFACGRLFLIVHALDVIRMTDSP